MRLIAVLAAALVATLLGVTAWFAFGPRASDRFAECRASAVAGGQAAIGGPFELTAPDGSRVTDAQVIDGPTLVYFGFTYCPDVCPTDLSRNAEVVSLLEERGVMVKPVMITVDPARDTPEVIGEYTSWMHPRMLGLTGSADDIEAAKSAYKVYAAKRGDGDDYTMDHTTFSYLMAPGEGLLDFFRSDLPAEEMADRIACFAGKL